MTLLVSCEKNVNDKVKIEKAMKEHARKNFSNPNNILEYVVKTYTAYVCDNSEAVITASTLGYNISIKMFDLDNGNELQLLIDYSKELAERRTFMQNVLKRGEDKAKDISKLCFKALDYENGVEWSPFE